MRQSLLGASLLALIAAAIPLAPSAAWAASPATSSVAHSPAPTPQSGAVLPASSGPSAKTALLAPGKGPTGPSSASIHVSILMYHHIAVPPADLAPSSATYFVSPQQFDQQMFYLVDHQFNVVSLDRVVAALNGGDALPPKAVALTVDDGWQDFWQNGDAIVQKYHLPVTIFPIADDHSSTYMNPSERWVLAHTGIQVGAHTLTHPHLTQLLPAMANLQITGSRKDLQTELGEPVDLFAYPYGDYNATTEAMVRAAGFQAGFAATVGPNEATADLYHLPRVIVSHYDTLQTFAEKAADYRWARTHAIPMPTPRYVPPPSTVLSTPPSVISDPVVDPQLVALSQILGYGIPDSSLLAAGGQ